MSSNSDLDKSLPKPAESCSFPLPSSTSIQSSLPSYCPVQPHWFHRHRVDAKLLVWLPFSQYDSNLLEEAETTATEKIVAVDGGRYDADLSHRVMRPVYWANEADSDAASSSSEIRRCTWFYRPDGEDASTTFIPYDEAASQLLERHYQRTVLSGEWRKQFSLACDGDGTQFVFLSPNVMMQMQSDGLASGGLGSGVLHRVVFRGMKQFPGRLPPDADSSYPVDHVLFVVHGIGSVYDLLGHNLVQCVDRMRYLAGELTRSHFASRTGRVEFLPVHWHSALRSDHTTGLDAQLKRISLQSIPKLRRFANDTLTDVLFYSSPRYMQTIVDTVGREINRLRRLFLSRNPSYTGRFSLVGHSLGSVIAFDILAHQGLAPATVPPSPTTNSTAAPSSMSNSSPDDTNKIELDNYLRLAGLGESANVRQKLTDGGIDSVRLLSALTDAELKELGIPLGPRKKLLAASARAASTVEDLPKLEQTKQQQPVPQPSSIQSAATSAAAASDSVTYIIGQLRLVGDNSGASSCFPCLSYPSLEFAPQALFAIGSPIALFLTSRGVASLSADYQLPAPAAAAAGGECVSGGEERENGPGLFNIFHPFDPIAYRLEPLLPRYPPEPFLIPHHKGRKRMHLQLRDSLARVGTDIRHRLVSGLRATWSSLQGFAAAHSQLQQQQPAPEDDSGEDNNSDASIEDVCDSALNGGRRLDYVLQEAPIEAVNDYLFALTSHACYWASEDTVLLMLTEVYRPLGVSQTPPPRTTAPSAAVSDS